MPDLRKSLFQAGNITGSVFSVLVVLYFSVSLMDILIFADLGDTPKSGRVGGHGSDLDNIAHARNGTAFSI